MAFLGYNVAITVHTKGEQPMAKTYSVYSTDDACREAEDYLQSHRGEEIIIVIKEKTKP